MKIVKMSLNFCYRRQCDEGVDVGITTDLIKRTVIAEGGEREVITNFRDITIFRDARFFFSHTFASSF